MPVVQITYDVPLAIAEGLKAGDLKMLGTAAVRNSTGISAHIREVSRTVSQGDNALGADIAKGMKDPKIVAVGLGVIAVVAAAGGAFGWITGKKRADAASAASEFAVHFNAALSSYLTAVDDGSVDVGRIDSLIAALNSMKKGADEGTIAVEISIEQWGAMVDAIAEYTRRLADANSVELHAPEVATTDSEGSAIVDLRHYLEAQRRMFERAA